MNMYVCGIAMTHTCLTTVTYQNVLCDVCATDQPQIKAEGSTPPIIPADTCHADLCPAPALLFTDLTELRNL